MSLESKTTPHWLDTPGIHLAGVHELQELISTSGDSALYRAQPSDSAQNKVLARLVHGDAPAIARQLQVWQSLAHAPHPNLLNVLSSGQTEAQGATVAYAITEGADENLATVLKDRALDSDEAGGILLTIVPALAHLHQAGFVHSRLCPAEFFAAGEAIKMSSECAHPIGEKLAIQRGMAAYCAPEQSDGNTTAAADVWCLAASLFEALTQKRFRQEDIAETQQLPSPYNRLLLRCLDDRAAARPSLADVLAIYENKDVPESAALPGQPVAPPTQETASVSESAGVPSPVVIAPEPDIHSSPTPPALAPQSASASEAPILSTPAKREPSPRNSQTTRLLALAALAVFVLVTFFWLRRTNVPPKQPITPAETDANARQIAPAPEMSTQPQAATPAQPSPITPSPTAPQTAESPAAGRAVWRVILWTFNQRDQAQSRADSLGRLHPDLHPEVFAPNQNAGPYLVIVGGQMTRQQADSTRATVRHMGLPRDSYVQNFNH